MAPTPYEAKFWVPRHSLGAVEEAKVPPIEETDLEETAVLWPVVSRDRYGNYRFGTKTEVDCRWINKQSQALDPNGQPTRVDASAVVADDIDIGSLMKLGTLASLEVTGTGPDANDNLLMEVVTVSSTPSINVRSYRRKVGLIFFKKTAPP